MGRLKLVACALDPVHFKLELTPNHCISYLENTGIRSVRSSRGLFMLSLMRGSGNQTFLFLLLLFPGELESRRTSNEKVKRDRLIAG